MNHFCHQLLRLLVETEGYHNLVFSPASLEMLFGMLVSGSQGQTKEALLQVLEVTEDELPQLTQRSQLASQTTIDRFQSIMDKKTICVFANSLWHHPLCAIRDSYRQTLHKDFSAGIFAFSPSLSETTRRINFWTSEKINRKLTNSPIELDQASSAVFINTLYLKASWNYDLKLEPLGDFHLLNGATATTRYMSVDQDGDLSANAYYLKEASFQALIYPSYDHRIQLEIYLPYTVDGLPELTKQLTPDFLAKCSKQFTRLQRFYLLMPKFEINHTLDFNHIASLIGLTNFAKPSLDWAPIFDQPRPHTLGNIIQPSKIFVHEKGLEASAFSFDSVTIGFALDTKIYFKVTHPFFYRVVETKTDKELFQGIFTTPTHQ